MKNLKPTYSFDEYLLKKAQTHDNLNRHLSEKLENEKKLHEEAKINARKEVFNAGSMIFSETVYGRPLQAKVAANEYLFREEFSKRVLSNILVNIIDEALLVDKTEYSKLNENYKNEIVTRVNKLLESPSLNLNCNEKTSKILSEISNNMPLNYSVYSLLEDSDITAISGKIMSNSDVRTSINDLVTDVRERVADIVLKDTEEMNKTKDEIASINSAVDEINQAHANNSTETTTVEKPAEIQADVLPEVQPQNQIVEESYASGIIESIALNEARIMLESGTYNSDLALANALKFVTVLEAFNATGLMDINDETYNNIQQKSTLRPFTPATPSFTNVQTPENEVAKPAESKIIIANVKPVTPGLPDGQKSFDQWLKEKELMKASNAEQQSLVSESGKYINDRGQILTESAVIEKLEDAGYDFRYDSLSDAMRINGWKKIK